MKKSTKTSIIAGVIIAVVGVVVLLCAVGASGWNFSRNTEWQEDTFDASSTVEKLDVKVNWGQVVINRGETETISVKYEYDNRYAPTFDEKNGKLSIETSKKRWYEINYWTEDAPRLEITVPQDGKFSEIKLTLNAGTVQFGNGEWCTTLNVNMNAGAMIIGQVSVGKLDIKMNAGALQADKIECDKVSCDMNAGAFEINEIVCREFNCEISAGSANLKKLDAQTIDLDLSAGSANLGLVGAKSDYNVKVSKSAGSCNVSSQTNASASRTLTVDLSAGSANVTFGK